MPDRTPGEPLAADSLTVRVVATAEGFDSLELPWRRLHEACEGTSVFQSFEWQRTWWHHFSEDKPASRLHLLVVEQGELPIAMAPFYIHTFRTLGVFRLRQLRLIGHVTSDYTDLLVRPGFEAAACEAITTHLRSSNAFDTMWFVDVPDASVLRTHITASLWKSGWHGHAIVGERCPQTRLSGNWDSTLAGFPDSQRKRVPSLDRKLRKNFQVEVRRVAPGEDPGPAFSQFMDMHQRRWRSAGEPGAFAGEVVRRFHRDVVQKLHRRGWLDLTFLMLDGKPVVANYSFKSGGRLQFYLSGSNEDERARKFAPGLMLHLYGMQAMIGEGIHTYDFLRGTERYKYDLGAHDVLTWRVGLVKDSLPIRVLERIQHARNTLGARAKQWVTARRATTTRGSV